MPYILDEKKLKKGDIILTRNESKTSKLICKISNSKYSHAILYLGNHSFMEADTNGVEFFSTQRYAFLKPENISVRRLKEQNVELINQLIINARKYSYRDYNMDGVKSIYQERMKGIKISPIEDINELGEWDKPLFCSQLIGVVFKQSGVELSKETSLDSFSSLEIENSILLEKVDDFLIEISDELSEQYTLHSEGELPENVLSKQTEVSQKMLKNIKVKYETNDLPAPADFQDAIDKFQTLSLDDMKKADQIIASELKTSGFLDLWQENKKLYPYLYNPFDLVQQWNLDNFNEMEQAIFQLNDLNKSICETIDFQKKNLATTNENYNKVNLETYKLLSEMYQNFIEDLESAKRNVEIALIPIQKIYEIINGINTVGNRVDG